MASGQRYGGMDGKLDQQVGENVGGMAHLGKQMSNDGPMTKIYNSKMTPKSTKMKPIGNKGGMR